MHLNRGYAACGIFSVIACVFYIVAISVPDLAKYDFLFINSVGNFTDKGHIYLGYFRACRRDFTYISNNCNSYGSVNNILTGAYANYNTSLDLCGIKDANLNDLQFCNKRTFVEAFTMVALFSTALAVAVGAKILFDDWCNGVGIYIPAVANMQAALCGLIAMSVWATFLSQVPAAYTAGASFILLIFGWFFNLLAAAAGYYALLAPEAKALYVKKCGPKKN